MINLFSKKTGIPMDIFQFIILPYTYLPQSKELLFDIRNYMTDIRILNNAYAFDYNDQILLVDLVQFCTTQDFNPQQAALFANKIPFLDTYIQSGWFPVNIKNPTNMIRLIWGLFTPSQRTRFINTYVLPD
jgi:hypothetical protein